MAISSREPAVAGQAEEVIDALLLAPGHQLLAGEAGVGASRIGTLGQRRRMRATRRAISSLAPAAASMFERRSFAANS